MKITEPKTPYVRYNAETDEFEGGEAGPCFFSASARISSPFFSAILDIPSLDLAGNNSGVDSPILQSPVSTEQPPPSPPVSPHRTSFSSGVNGRSSSGSVRSRSGSSSRSTSFSLPNEAKGEILSQRRATSPDDEEVEEEEEMDEEGKPRAYIHLWLPLTVKFPPPAAAKHAAFVKARGRHYSNEAEAMKVHTLHSSLELR